MEKKPSIMNYFFQSIYNKVMKLGLKTKFLFVFSFILAFALINLLKEPANAINLKPSSSISCVNNAVAPLDNLKDIQTFLNCNGFNPGPIDGLEGSRTTNAIVSFQKTVGLTADGVVGPATKQAMRGYSSCLLYTSPRP